MAKRKTLKDQIENLTDQLSDAAVKLDAEEQTNNSILKLLESNKQQEKISFLRQQMIIESLTAQLAQNRLAANSEELAIAMIEQKTGKEWQRPGVVLNALENQKGEE